MGRNQFPIGLVSVSDNMGYSHYKWTSGEWNQVEPLFGITSDGNNPYYRSKLARSARHLHTEFRVMDKNNQSVIKKHVL